jgi:hypothetical protein
MMPSSNVLREYIKHLKKFFLREVTVKLGKLRLRKRGLSNFKTTPQALKESIKTSLRFILRNGNHEPC